MKTEERLQGLSDALKLVERDIERIENLTDLAKGTVSFVRNQIEFLQRNTGKREEFPLVEVRCEDSTFSQTLCATVLIAEVATHAFVRM